MGPPEPRESQLLDEQSMELLSTAYLLRPASVEALEAALGSVPDDFDERIRALEAGGFLRLVDGAIEYESPYAVFVALGEARARALVAENLRTVALMEALPRLIRAWDLGTADPEGDHPLAVTLVHARSDSWDEWFRHADAETPQRPSLVCPDPQVLRVALGTGHLERLRRQIEDEPVRVLVPGEPGWDAEVPELASLMERAAADGIVFRQRAGLPSWMYVDAPSIAALPVWWGSGTPESAIVIRTPPVVAAMDLLFSRLWAHAEPWGDTEEPWADVVRLLADGLTDDAVAHALGITPRTVRRRVAEAMAELGAVSRFTLGAAWSQRGR